MLALYAQRALGTLIGGDRGRSLIEGCDARLRAEGVVNPESWARIWIEPSDEGALFRFSLPRSLEGAA